MESYLTTIKTLAAASFNARNAVAIIRALQDREEYDSALLWADKAVDSGISVAPLHLARAKILSALNRWEEAVSSHKMALSVAPNDAALYVEFGKTLFERFRDYDGAEQLFIRAIEINPNDQLSYNGYAESVIHQGMFQDILSSGKLKLDGSGNDIRLLSGIAAALIDYGRYEEAQECAEIILSRVPDHWIALSVLAQIADEQLQDFDAGWRYLTKAIKNNPDDVYCYRAYFIHLLKVGDWGRARAVFREAYRRMRPNFLHYEGKIPFWDGTPLQGKTILLDSWEGGMGAMGGHGDAIQFIRFAHWLKKQGATVGVISRKATLSLMATMPWIDFAIERYDERPFVDYIFELSLLWVMLDVEIEEVGSVVPYLSPPPQKSEMWKTKIPRTADLNVGIVWKSDPLHRCRNRYKKRDMPITDLCRLSQIPGVQLYSLQKEGLPEGFNQTSSGAEVKDLSSELGDFYNTAAVVSALDVVVTIDTAIGHVAAAMGKPVFILLPYSSDPRWLLNRDDSPWYPSVRLFRQDKPADWAEGIQRVADALRSHVRPTTGLPLS
jgi:tetratricopeptide (TPR) repeat protein